MEMTKTAAEKETLCERLKEFTNEKNAFMLYNGIRIMDVAEDYAVTSADLSANSLNPLGAAHGGFLFTMADCATGAAARSDGRHYVTLSTSLNYLRMAREGIVTATANVTKRGRTVTVVDVVVESAGMALASGSFTYFCLDEK